MTTLEQLTGAEEVEWDLSDLYASPDDPKLEDEIAGAERAATAFRERHNEAVASLSASDLAEAIAEREEIESAVDRALTYAHLRFATNMADPTRGALVAKLTERAAAIETTLLFFTLELAAMEDGPAETRLADLAFEHWHHWLTSLRKYRPHLLSEPEERVMTEKSVSGSSSWSRLYSELLSSLRATVDGEEVPLETAMSNLYSADRDTRRTTAEAVTEALGPGLRTRVRLQHDPAGQVDRRQAPRLPDVDLGAQPRERDDRRGGRRTHRSGRLAVRAAAPVLPAQG